MSHIVASCPNCVVFVLITCRQDCANFGIEVPEFSVVDEVESDLKKHEDMWSLFDEFNTGNYSYIEISCTTKYESV
jgi:hypothetical protein